VLSCCLPSGRSHPQQNTMQLSTAQNRREEEEAGATYRDMEDRNGARGSECIAYGFVLLDSIGYNWVFICLVKVICGQQSSCELDLRTKLSFSFPYFPLAIPLFLAGPTSVSANLLPHRITTAHKFQEFSTGRWKALSSTRTVNYNQATRCHIPEYGNVPKPRLCCMDY